MRKKIVDANQVRSLVVHASKCLILFYEWIRQIDVEMKIAFKKFICKKYTCE